MILSFILLMLAAICDAIMDTSVQHYSTSIFSALNPLWWNGAISWQNKYIDGDPNKGIVKWWFGLDKPVQLTDAFHFFKMWMVIFICVAICVFPIWPISFIYSLGWISYPLIVLILGCIWNFTFSLFYNKILIKKS